MEMRKDEVGVALLSFTGKWTAVVGAGERRAKMEASITFGDMHCVSACFYVYGRDRQNDRERGRQIRGDI